MENYKCSFCDKPATQYFISGWGSIPVPVCDKHKYRDVTYSVGSMEPLGFEKDEPPPPSEDFKEWRNQQLRDIDELNK